MLSNNHRSDLVCSRIVRRGDPVVIPFVPNYLYVLLAHTPQGERINILKPKLAIASCPDGGNSLQWRTGWLSATATELSAEIFKIFRGGEDISC